MHSWWHDLNTIADLYRKCCNNSCNQKQ